MLTYEFGEVLFTVFSSAISADGLFISTNVAIDIEVIYQGVKYCGTLFTLDILQNLLDHYKKSGECAYGKYFWAEDMLIVESFYIKTIELALNHVIKSGEIKYIFSQSAL